MHQGDGQEAPQGAAPPVTLSSGDTSLLGACRHGHQDKINALLRDRTVNVNCRGDQGMTPLMMAATNRQVDVIKLLVKNGADPTLVDNAGQNVLHWASMENDEESVKFILSLRWVNINAKTTEGRTATDWARFLKHRDMVKTLLGLGAEK